MGLDQLFISLVKILAILAWVYGLLRVLGLRPWWAKLLGIVGAWAIVQAILVVPQIPGISGYPERFGFNDFDKGLVIQACTMSMVALGLNLIYGFNGQFSLGQWGFYGIGAYAAADISYRWMNRDASGLFVAALLVALIGLALLLVGRLIARYKGMPVLSQFTLYLIGTVIAGVASVLLGNALAGLVNPALGTSDAPNPVMLGVLMENVVIVLAILIGGAFAAEVSFLFGLPVLSLGSDYFGIATLGFSIVVQTLMVNTDTLLPFPEMKGGRGMIGIPKLPMVGLFSSTEWFSAMWFWAFVFLLLVLVLMRNLIYSSTGRAIISVREDETAAKAMGIDVARYKLLAFVVGSLFAGLGGGVYAHFIGFLSPNTFFFVNGFNPLIIIVFGGLGSMTGTITAAFGWIFFLEGLLRVILGQLGTDAPTWRFVLYPIALLLLMLLRPQGLLGNVEWGFFRQPRIRPRADRAAQPLPTPVGK